MATHVTGEKDSRPLRRTIVAAVAIAWSAWCMAGLQATAQPVASDSVVATVNMQPIYVAEVQRIVKQSLKDRPVAESARPAVEAQALEQAIDQRLVTAWLAREKQGTSDAEVDAAVKDLKAQAATVKVPFAEFLKQQATDEAGLRRELAWRLGWRRYLSKQVTDAALQQFFEDHRREYDGTQVRASQILWKLDATAGAAAATQAIEQARQVRKQIVAGMLSFADAAAKHSQAPSRTEGGDVGFFPRRGVMDEAFARTAFDLKQGNVSEPLTSPFGVHLIQVTEVRPGSGKWTEVREAVEAGLTVELFARLSQAERKTARIEYTGAASHFKPGTRDVVAPR